jgi:hypothetical protein
VKFFIDHDVPADIALLHVSTPRRCCPALMAPVSGECR